MGKHTKAASGAKRFNTASPMAILALAVMGILVGAHITGCRGSVHDAGSESSSVQAQHGGNDSSGVLSSGQEARQEESAEDGATTSREEGSTIKSLFEHKNTSSVRLVGDSITAGFGTDGYEPLDEGVVVYNDGNGDVWYEGPTTSKCWANAFRDYALQHGVKDFVNAGINGAFMKELAQNPDAWLDKGADVVFVALGTNDAGYYGIDEFREDAKTGLAAAASKSKRLVVLAPVRDLRPIEQLVEPADALGEVLKDICEEEGYTFVDPRDYVTDQMFAEDGLHPNSEGSLAIWDCIVQTLDL